MKTSNASKASGQWYFEMANKIESKRDDIFTLRIEIDRRFRYQFSFSNYYETSPAFKTRFIDAVIKWFEFSIEQLEKTKKLLKNK